VNQKIICDLDLGAHGLRIVERPISNFLPLDDRSFLKVGGGQTKREVAKFSARDTDRLDDYQTRLAAAADILRASGPCHVWTAPADQGFFCGVAFDRGCGHVFGLLMWVMTPVGPDVVR
jgi:phytoene dehydrogenase-like protein